MLRPDLNLAEGEVFLVHKPKQWTSFDVVNKMRSVFKIKKIGHAGTLDLLASGLLIVCTGKKTKEIDRYMGLEKEYRAAMLLGARTESFDSETPIVERRSTDGITSENVMDTLRSFVGHQSQIPPMWSAVKVKGRRLYKYARKGIEVERNSREIFIRSITPIEIAIPSVSFTVVCSKGTYIRALVNDVGAKLGCGAYLTDLVRTKIGDFRLADAVTIEEISDYAAKNEQGCQ